MDTLEQITSLFAMRDSLLDSMPYTAPEDVKKLDKELERVMWRVLRLIGNVEWVE